MFVAVMILIAMRPQINNKLQILNSGLVQFVDDTPIEQRSPSPPPLYNESGTRINTRDQRIKDKLIAQRNVSMRHAWGICSGGEHAPCEWHASSSSLACRPLSQSS